MANKLETIGAQASERCSFTSLTLSPNVTDIGSKAFSGCPITNLNAEGDARVSPDSFGFESLERVLFTSSVSDVSHWNFTGCTFHSNLTLPEGLASIGSWAFAGCSSLDSIEAEGIEEVDEGAFQGCFNLVSITFENEVSLGDGAFNLSVDGQSALDFVLFKGGINKIGESNFNGLDNLSCVYFNSSSIPEGLAFQNTSLSVIFVSESFPSTELFGLPVKAIHGSKGFCTPPNEEETGNDSTTWIIVGVAIGVVVVKNLSKR